MTLVLADSYRTYRAWLSLNNLPPHSTFFIFADRREKILGYKRGTWYVQLTPMPRDIMMECKYRYFRDVTAHFEYITGEKKCHHKNIY